MENDETEEIDMLSPKPPPPMKDEDFYRNKHPEQIKKRTFCFIYIICLSILLTVIVLAIVNGIIDPKGQLPKYMLEFIFLSVFLFMICLLLFERGFIGFKQLIFYWIEGASLNLPAICITITAIFYLLVIVYVCIFIIPHINV